jgi:hypothetical protein
MKILKFKKAQPPRVKKKPVPRLRVIRDQKDIRLSRQEFQAAFDAWLPTVGKFTYTCEDRDYVWVSIAY